MLDVRATRYVSPLSEVEFTDVVLTVRLSNIADETGYITGAFRVYNDTTGLLIHTSDIEPISLAAGQTADVSALTSFSPPAPLDDTYFVLFDGQAVNALVPDEIGIHLGAWHFDVKPGPLGEPPEAHAPTHEQAGADPLDAGDLGTAELDTTLRLAPDGAGGVVWGSQQAPLSHHASHELDGADPITISHEDLTDLTTGDPHTQYRLRHEIYYACEFLFPEVGLWDPWRYYAPGNGAASGQVGSAEHPGIIRFLSSVNANSGFGVMLGPTALILSGAEVCLCWHRPATLAGTTRHFGFHDSITVADPVDGAWIWQDPATGIIYGRTRSNSVGSTTGTGFQLVTNTWYCEKIIVNADASQVDFYCYDDAGAELWHDSLTTNIPTATGRELSNTYIATNSGTTAVALADLDYLSILIPDRRPTL